MKKFSKKEIDEILHNHKLWVNSEGLEGELADFSYSNLSGNIFPKGTFLQKANFTGANLKSTSFKSAYLQYAKFQDASLRDADFSGSNLYGANFLASDLCNTDLEKANLEGANFESAYLGGAKLFGANLENANFEDTDLSYAELSSTKLNKNVNEKIKPESEKDVFNKFAFSDKKRRGLNPPFEESNDEEDYVYYSLYKHFVNNDPFDDHISGILSTILSQKKYPDIIQEYQKTIYRGMTVETSFLKNIVGITKKDLDDLDNIEKSFVFKPKSKGSSSWSESKAEARNFALKNKNLVLEDSVNIVLVANHEDNKNKFLKCTNTLYKFFHFEDYEEEKEVIGLGDIKVSKIIVLY
jgi:hypothetical protein